jgi:hypothetical protein
MRHFLAGLALMSALPAAAPAQRAPRWKQIGTTSSGNPVFVDPRSVKRHGALVSADVRVVFKTPVKAAAGMWASSRTSATFDCARKSLAARENVFYADAAGTKVTERKVNKIPGYGPALGGSLGGVALEYLCSH